MPFSRSASGLSGYPGDRMRDQGFSGQVAGRVRDRCVAAGRVAAPVQDAGLGDDVA
jgi:hypothetical protein